MVGCFGLRDDHHHTRFPLERLVENGPRLDVWMLLQCGALYPDGAVTDVILADGSGLRLTREGGFLEIDGTSVPVVWDEPMPGVSRPWFEVSGRRCRYLYLRDGRMGSAGSFGLENFSRHFRRQTPQVGRIERFRHKLGNCELKPFAPLPPLRRGRSRAYHEKLVAMIHAEEAKLLGHLQTITRTLDRRIRIRKARGKW